MNEHEKRQLEVATGAHTDIVSPPPKRSSNGGLEFFKDLLAGSVLLVEEQREKVNEAELVLVAELTPVTNLNTVCIAGKNLGR